MFRLIKLASYLLLGYVLYEVILGISEGESLRAAAKSGSGGRSGSLSAASGRSNSPPSRPTSVEIGDETGASRQTRVGRGVISQ